MAKFMQQWWSPRGEGYSRSDRQGGDYAAYHPDLLVGRQFELSARVSAQTDCATHAAVRLDNASTTPGNSKVLNQALLRAESMASSRIEGLQISARKLFRAEAQRSEENGAANATATEVLANIDAMVHAVIAYDSNEPITPKMILEIHACLMRGGHLEHCGGKLRTDQNWIGGSAFNPCKAQFVPPPPTLVPELMADLCAFCNDDALNAIAQAAIAHAQFETIHPFLDGNGRTGRAIVHLVLRRRNLSRRVLTPLSVVLATMGHDYIDGLRATYYEGAPTSQAARAGLNFWVGRFAEACKQAAEQGLNFVQHTMAIQATWRDRLGAVPAGSETDLLAHCLVSAPVVSVKTASLLIDRKLCATNDAIAHLVAAKILNSIFLGKQRDRIFEARDVIDAFAALGACSA